MEGLISWCFCTKWVYIILEVKGGHRIVTNASVSGGIYYPSSQGGLPVCMVSLVISEDNPVVPTVARGSRQSQ